MAGTVVEELVALLGYEIRDDGAVKKFEGQLKGLEKRVEGIGRAIGTGMIAVGAAVAGGLSYLGYSALSTGATFESLEVRLESLEGSSENAKAALDWVQDFAGKTPLALSEVANAYASLKTFGIDPMNGSLMAAVDTMAMSGQKADFLNGIILAMGQAWTKGKLQGEEALQLIERGVPVWELLSKEMGKTAEEIQELSKKGKLGRKELQLLFNAMGKRAAGASEKASKTWNGIMDRFGDKWEKFLKIIADSGYFDAAKKKLEQFADIVDGWFEGGTAEKVAKQLSSWFVTAANVIGAVFRQIAAHISFLVKNWEKLAPYVKATAIALGVLAAAARPVLTIFVLLAIAVDDFLTWMEGGDSIIGRFANKLKELFGISDGLATLPFPANS